LIWFGATGRFSGTVTKFVLLFPQFAPWFTLFETSIVPSAKCISTFRLFCPPRRSSFPVRNRSCSWLIVHPALKIVVRWGWSKPVGFVACP
jgi:hypothetical protein